MEKLCDRLDAIIKKIGLSLAWVNCVLVVAIILNVVMRYGFGKGQVWLEELQWHLYSFACMFGVSYCYAIDSHIRVDIIQHNMARQTKRFWEMFGIVVFLSPWIISLFIDSIDYWLESWRVNERSDSPLGLPFRWIIKGVIPVSMFMLAVAAFSRFLRNLAEYISGKREAADGS